jgi:glyoxylase-like metal-dependent hydrolase (beta-lactamase superfamily II)
MKIIPLSEGSFTIDKTKVFVPFDEAKDFLRERPTGSLLVEVQPFLMITGNDVLLLDTGLGFINENGIPQIHQLLIDEGINPSEVTKVLMSHLHKDHSGGVGITGTNKLTFPAAKYYVQKKELEFALNDTSSSYIKEDLLCLQDARQVVLLDGDGIIDGYIHYEMTAAHTRYHQVFKIKENDKIIFFGGDDAPQYQQMKNKYVAKYDFDGKKCMQLRQQWGDEGAQAHWTFLFYHDIKTPVMSL